jgi:multicomponent Na+:H+ antiporter subunit B
MKRRDRDWHGRLRPSSPEELSVLVRTIVRAVLPIALLFGFYIISYGHLSPGGGFQGGMILVGAVVAFYLAYGYNILQRFHHSTLELVEAGAILLFLVIGLFGLFGRGFLDNLLPDGIAGNLLSGGFLPILNFAVGLKVAAGTLFVVIVLLETLRKGED